MGVETKNIEEVIAEEKIKFIRSLEKSLQNEPEYKEIKEYLENDHDKKMQYLQTVALKYTKAHELPVANTLELNEYNSYTSKHREMIGGQWSEAKSNPTGVSYYSSSVRNSRYKHFALGEDSKKQHLENLKVI
jgi:hypothetical protein